MTNLVAAVLTAVSPNLKVLHAFCPYCNPSRGADPREDGRGVRGSPTSSAQPRTRRPAGVGWRGDEVGGGAERGAALGAPGPPLPPAHYLGGAGAGRLSGPGGGGRAESGALSPVRCCAARTRPVFLPRSRARAAAMSWELLLWLLALCALLALVVQLLRFVRADGDLTLLWAEWQGRRPGEDPRPRLLRGRPGSVRPSPLSPHSSGRLGASAPFPGTAWGGRKSRDQGGGPAPWSLLGVSEDLAACRTERALECAGRPRDSTFLPRLPGVLPLRPRRTPL